MAFLTPDYIYPINGIKVNQKYLPIGKRPGKKLNTPGNKPQWVTIHNTDDINEASGTTDAEQYARATFNGAMGDVTVHFYIDETDCWQILPLDEIGYHAADYKNKKGGNWTSIAIEIIEKNGKEADDIEAEDRGARLAAGLLKKFGLGIDRLTTHTRWYPKKTCPIYILPHWDAFKNLVEAYMYEAGDIDMDGKVTAADARLALRAAVNAEKLSDVQKIIADTDGDGKITSADARDILRESVGME